MAGIELEVFRDHPLAGVGLAAVSAPESTEVLPELQKFEDAIRSYSVDRIGVDWALVERLGTALASQRCDLKIYGYLVLAAFYRASAEEDESPFLALAAALHAMGDVVEKGWERCVPKIVARRQIWFKWLSEELTGPVKARAPKPAEQAAFRACVQEAERVADLSGKALGLDYPLLRELRETLTSLAPPPAAAPPPPLPPPKRPPEPAPAPPAIAASPPVPALPAPAPAATPAPTSGAASPAEPPSVPILTDPTTMSRDALEDSLAATVTVLAGQLRSESLSDPAPYWLLRALRWAGHDLLRPERMQEVLANQNKTPLPLPADHKSQSKQIPAWLLAGRYAEVIAECEELFATYPLWLDLQRWVVSALTALGATPAQKAITAQLTLLLARCPQIARFRFSDRDTTPFADEETATWLNRQLQRTESEERPTALPAEVPAIAIPEGLLPGVQFLQKALTQATSGRRRFELQLDLAELLLTHQRSDIAMPVVDALLGAAEAHRLAEWHPELCERALRLAVKTARAAELEAPRRAALWSKLCQLSPTEALQLGPETL